MFAPADLCLTPLCDREVREGLILFILGLVGLAAIWLFNGYSVFATLLWLLPIVVLSLVATWRGSVALAALSLLCAAGVWVMSFTPLSRGWHRMTEAIRDHAFVASLTSAEREFYRRYVASYGHPDGLSGPELITQLTSQIKTLEESSPPSLEWARLAKATVASARFYRDVLAGRASADRAKFDRLVEVRKAVLLRIKRRSAAWKALGWTPRPAKAGAE